MRLFEAAGQTLELEQLGFPADLLDALTRLLRERTGAVFLTGPSGSGTAIVPVMSVATCPSCAMSASTARPWSVSCACADWTSL